MAIPNPAAVAYRSFLVWKSFLVAQNMKGAQAATAIMFRCFNLVTKKAENMKQMAETREENRLAFSDLA